MYKIPVTFDKEDLVGCSVQQIGYTSNSITLFLDGDIYIEIMGFFEMCKKNHCIKYGELYPIKDDMGLLCLLDKCVSSISICNNRNELIVYFDEDYYIHINGNPKYEFLRIKIKDEVILM